MQSPTSQTHDLWTLVATLCRNSQPKKMQDPKVQTAKIQQMWSSTIYVSEVVNKTKMTAPQEEQGANHKLTQEIIHNPSSSKESNKSKPHEQTSIIQR